MIEFIVVERETGKIVRSGFSANPGVDQVLEPGEVVLITEMTDPARYHVSAEGIVPIPPRPEGWVEWNGEAWVDPRSPAQVSEALYTTRQRTSLDKSELLTRMLLSGLLPVSDIEAAGEGRIPPSLEPALAMLPPEAQVVARIKWRNDPVISRTNPVIVLAGAALGMSEEQLDTLFGVVSPI